MKTLYESLLDIDNIKTDTDITEYISPEKFQELYKRKLKSIVIGKNNPICITGNNIHMINLCKNFKAKNIDLSGVYPELKIREMYNFVSDCKNLIDFKGPDAHVNYSETNSLEWFFDSDFKLKTFDLNGIAESAKKIEYIGSMFKSCTSIEYIDLSYFDFSKLSNIDFAFSDCPNLKQIDLGNSSTIAGVDKMCWKNFNLKEFNAPNMILMGSYAFFNCGSLRNINVKYIDVTENNYNPFYGCYKLENVNIYGLNGKSNSLDLSWAVSLNDKSWDFLFGNMRDGNNAEILLPDIPKKKNLIEKYELIAKKHNFILI